MQNISTVAMHAINATVPPLPAATPILMVEPSSVLLTILALLGLVIPMIFYLIWIAVGIAALVYLLRRLKGR